MDPSSQERQTEKNNKAMHAHRNKSQGVFCCYKLDVSFVFVISQSSIGRSIKRYKWLPPQICSIDRFSRTERWIIQCLVSQEKNYCFQSSQLMRRIFVRSVISQRWINHYDKLVLGSQYSVTVPCQYLLSHSLHSTEKVRCCNHKEMKGDSKKLVKQRKREK